jgi:hypothetical protein
VTSDPSTGQALNLTLPNGTVSMYLTDGIGNQVAALTDDADQAWATRYAPYGQQNVTSGDTTDHGV